MQTVVRRARHNYDHRIREAIAFTGNPHLYRNISIPISTRRTWATGRIAPVVTDAKADLGTYQLLDQLDRLERRIKRQAAIIGLLTRLVKLRGGKLNGDRLPDARSENFGDVNTLLGDSSWLERIVAQTEIIYSNSMIEAWWRELKHRWLFLHLLTSATAVRNLVAFYVEQHNAVVPRSLLKGRTPDEVYLEREADLPKRLSAQHWQAQQQRIAHNRARRCERCEPAAATNAMRLQHHRTFDVSTP